MERRIMNRWRKSDILSITSVHPMRKEAVEAFIKRADNNWNMMIISIMRESCPVRDNIIWIRRSGSRYQDTCSQSDQAESCMLFSDRESQQNVKKAVYLSG